MQRISALALLLLATCVHGWVRTGRSPRVHTLELVFAVRQTNLPLLEATVLAVSDPTSSRYGMHLSNEAVHDLVKPAEESVAAITNFLEDAGLKVVSLTPNSDFLAAEATVEQAEALLGAEYHALHHAETNTTVHRCDAYALPPAVAAHVDMVAPTVHVPPTPKPRRRTLRPLESANATAPLFGNSPKHLRSLYSVDVEGKAAANSMAVTAFLEQTYSVADLHEFWTLFCGGITCGKGDPTTVGDKTKGPGKTESMLDIQSITGVAGNVHAEFWGFSGRSPDNKENEPFLKWLTTVSNTSDAAVPKLFSTSYGEDEDAWSLAAANRMNVEFQKAGARGISLLFASGDSGANCQGGRLKPQAPGSSPWVTAVGGTGGSGLPERAIGLSSGGFSDRWASPSWQTSAVKKYLSSAAGLPPKSSGYNVSGRAYPDISAQGQGFTVVIDRIPLPGVAGTSCASPTASGVIALLNDARLQAGKPTLGFLNPWIYQQMGDFNDVTTGSSGGGCSGGGWPAAAGWDAVTGVGTPNYGKLARAL